MSPRTNLHVLLIGVDAYRIANCALYGCVHDIDAIQRVLIEQAGVAVERVTRLVSPHAGVQHETAVAGREATLANIRGALEELGSAAVGANDRVLIYYSGHGSRVPVTVDRATTFREALVPVDITAAGNYLFDHEFNALLAKISLRTRQVTVILDCCHSAGATRGDGRKVRQIDHYDHVGASGPVVLPAGTQATRGLVGDEGGGVGVCQVIAACQGNELAEERADASGVRHGLLTRALLTALAGRGATELHALRWAAIWPKIVEEVAACNDRQHPWLAGTLGRAVLGGPPTAGDFGFTLTALGGSRFAVGAGTLMRVTEGAQLAVFVPGLDPLPALDSEDDLRARVGLLTVTTAGPGRAEATFAGPGFVPPAGARVRVVVPGPAGLLRVAVVAGAGRSLDDLDQALLAELRTMSLVTIVDAEQAELRLVRGPAGWSLHDRLQREHAAAPPLCVLPLNEVRQTRALCEQYLRHSLPLRIAAQCEQGELAVELLAVPKDMSLTPEQAQTPTLAGVPAGEYAAELRAGDRFCVRVVNRSHRILRVTLVNVAASGKVQRCGDQVIAGESMHVFWAGSQLGKPFGATLAARVPREHRPPGGDRDDGAGAGPGLPRECHELGGGGDGAPEQPRLRHWLWR